MTQICPTGSSNAQSGDIGDQGDFGLPTEPEYTSQKNLVAIAYDPRTNTLLATQGMYGNFNEDPATSTKIIRSKDCGATWTQISDSDTWLGDAYNEPGGVLGDLWHLPRNIIPGHEAGHWIIFDYASAYYVSEDDGVTWSARQYAGLDGGVVIDDFIIEYHGNAGHHFDHNTRYLPAWNYLEAGQIGYPYIVVDVDGEGPIGIRRSMPNGEWEDSLVPGIITEGGAGWHFFGSSPLTLRGANGRWIAIVGSAETQDFENPRNITPNVRVNTSANLDPGSWSTPFWLVSEAFVTDPYEGNANHISSFDRQLENLRGHHRLRFIPIDGHAAGGRWWFMGQRDCLLFSDDNGDTWSKALCDHTGPEENMHPILNWRDSHDYTTRYETARVLDIISDPLNSGRLISIGVTYDREGITNRLAVFSCSTDGGDTWGTVRQLPLSLNAIASEETGPGADSPAIARHVFPCMGGS